MDPYLPQGEQDFRDRALRILETTPEAVVAVDKSWCYTFFNAAAERLYGLRRDEVIGKTLWKIIPNIIGTEVEDRYCKAMARRISEDFQTFHAFLQKWLHIRVYPDTAGGLFIFLQDITSKKTENNQTKKASADTTMLLGLICSENVMSMIPPFSVF